MVSRLFAAKPSQKPSQLVALFVFVLGSALQAQTSGRAEAWEREQLPLRFAKASTELAKRLGSDWRRMAHRGLEWGYCVTDWKTATTPDGDTVYIATRATMRQSLDATLNEIRFDCIGDDNKPLPKIHTHLSGDCTPSRGDITDALSREIVPFGLIVCGPGLTVAIDPQLYASALGYHVSRSP